MEDNLSRFASGEPCLEGYTSHMVVEPGSTLDVMLSGGGEADLSLARLIHGDPNPEGPGVKQEPQSWWKPRRRDLGPQALDPGSYLVVDDDIGPAASFSVSLWYRPSLLQLRWHTLLGRWMPRALGFGVFCAEKTLAAGISVDGTNVAWGAGMEMVSTDRWQFVALTYDAASGGARIYQSFGRGRARVSPHEIVRTEFSAGPGGVHRASSPLMLGASADHQGRHRLHFNGRLSEVSMWAGVLSDDEVGLLVDHQRADVATTPIALWDSSLGIGSPQVPDVSGNGFHATAVNSPARGVPGPLWTRDSYNGGADRLTAPHLFDAVHFHDDDLTDAGWIPTETVEVPEDTRSGIYAVTVRDERLGDELVLPFVASARTPTAGVAVLIPTLTWYAYGANRLPYTFSEDGVLDLGLSLYDTHSDGTAPYYTSRLRPTRSNHPGRGFQRWGANKVTSNLYLLDWLEHEQFAYDVLADETLHTRGVGGLTPYTCVILGSHPEYWTEPMMSALSSYLNDGGRVMYLGGNGLYWVTSFDEHAPHIMEVRKEVAPNGPPITRPPGEAVHSTTDDVGGMWEARGRPVRGMLGVEYTANVWTNGAGKFGFVRTDESFTDRFTWIFEGVSEPIIGDYGLNQGSAAGMELDSTALPWDWTGRPAPVPLARATHEYFFSHREADPAYADIAWLDYPHGGAVFSAGSITWTGSLSHSGYRNGVSRITRNVLERFLADGEG